MNQQTDAKKPIHAGRWSQATEQASEMLTKKKDGVK